jgi:hypothetical protein
VLAGATRPLAGEVEREAVYDRTELVAQRMRAALVRRAPPGRD